MGVTMSNPIRLTHPTHLTRDTEALLGVRICIWFNGHEMAKVVQADTAEGWVEVLQTDGLGRPILVGDEIQSVFLYGCVEARVR